MGMTGKVQSYWKEPSDIMSGKPINTEVKRISAGDGNISSTLGREGPNVESAMLQVRMVFLERILTVSETRGDETAFQFTSQGNVIGIARRGSDSAQIVRSSPHMPSGIAKILIDTLAAHCWFAGENAGSSGVDVIPSQVPKHRCVGCKQQAS